MNWGDVLKRLYKLNVLQSSFIVFSFGIPLIFLILEAPFVYFSSKRLAHIAITFFSLSFLLYPFLFTISRIPKSRVRKRLVMFTRIYIRFHIAFAIFGTFLILIHSIFMLRMIPIQSSYAVTGMIAFTALLAVVSTGILRKFKSSGKRRRYHRYMGFLFIIFVILHIFA